MKKIVLFAAVAGVALAGCAKVEKTVTGEPGNVPVVFEPVANNLATKAIPGEVNTDYSIGTDPKQYESFKVWAGYKKGTNAGNIGEIEGDYFSGVTASPNSTSSPKYWSATNAYWPKGEDQVYLSFHAFSPSDLTPTHTWTNGFTLTDYTVDPDVTKQIDILYSDYTMNKQRKDYNTSNPYDDDPATGDDGFASYNGVNILFRHALSSIKFKVKTAADYTQAGTHTFTVKAIRIGYAYQTGTFYENRPNNATGTEYATVPTAEAGHVNVINTWATETTNPYWSVATDSELATTPSDGTSWTAAYYTVYDNTTGTIASKDEAPIGNTVLAMPQPLNHGSNKVQVQVVYDYECKTAGGTSIVTLTNQVKNIDLNTLKGEDTVETGERDIDKWLINHRYTYDIVFKLDQIIFDPKVVDYIDVTIDTVTVD